MIDNIRDAPGRFTRRTKTTFASLSVRNYRLFFVGQAISLSGTWMQTIAQGWLVLQLTGSGTQVGFVVALQFLPLLLITPFGGMIADAFPKRRTLIITQSLFVLQNFVLGVVVITGVVHMWMVYALALAFGIVNSVDNPTRQSFVSELVSREYVRNAVALNATEIIWRARSDLRSAPSLSRAWASAFALSPTLFQRSRSSWRSS